MEELPELPVLPSLTKPILDYTSPQTPRAVSKEEQRKKRLSSLHENYAKLQGFETPGSDASTSTSNRLTTYQMVNRMFKESDDTLGAGDTSLLGPPAEPYVGPSPLPPVPTPKPQKARVGKRKWNKKCWSHLVRALNTHCPDSTRFDELPQPVLDEFPWLDESDLLDRAHFLAEWSHKRRRLTPQSPRTPTP